MKLRSVAVLGGGPGGLYVARLLKLRDPECQVDLYEQIEPQNTFGFGVGLATRTQRNLEAADPASLRDIVQASHAHEMSMVVGDSRVQIPVDNLIAIGRTDLLGILRRHAEAAGVNLHYGARVGLESLDVELVVAADGVSSATRERFAAELGAKVETHDSFYLWCGTNYALPSAVFAPAETEFGTFVAHGYPYGPDRSTFLVETDPETWRRAGFDRTTETTPFDANDDESLAYLTKAFHGELAEHVLVGNRTRWLQFRTVTCERWSHENVVLLGDAAHTAHYSIGSGTKLAMEDGIALVDALEDAPDLEIALKTYEAARRPAVEHLQSTAQRSMRWWDSFPKRLDMPVEQLLIAYMTRAGKVTLDRFGLLAPGVVQQGLAQYGACAPAEVPVCERVEWVLSRPFVSEGLSATSRLVDSIAWGHPIEVALANAWSEDADRLLDRVIARSALEGSSHVVLTAVDDAEAVLTLFDFAERVRREAGLVVVARLADVWTEFAASALASGRVDLVDLQGRA